MNWMKANVGNTLQDAIKEWNKIYLKNKKRANRKEIAPQFEYNSYKRDFLEDNPEFLRKTAIEYWKIKKSLRGDNIYKKSNLDLINERNNTDMK